MRLNPGLLHWECCVLGTEPPGKSLYIILETVSWSDNDFTHSVGCLCTFLMVSCEAKKFLLLIVSNFFSSVVLFILYLRHSLTQVNHEDLILFSCESSVVLALKSVIITLTFLRILFLLYFLTVRVHCSFQIRCWFKVTYEWSPKMCIGIPYIIVLFFITFCRHYIFFLSFFLYKLKVCGNPELSKSMSAIFPIAFACFLSPCHILVILIMFQTFHQREELWLAKGSEEG